VTAAARARQWQRGGLTLRRHDVVHMASLVHASKQAPVVASQAKWFAQVFAAPPPHVPLPSQVRPSIDCPGVAPHAAGQGVPAGYSWQAPLPSQRGVVPQLAAPASVQIAFGSTAPAGTGLQ
jgi:hypothetical protein